MGNHTDMKEQMSRILIEAILKVLDPVGVPVAAGVTLVTLIVLRPYWPYIPSEDKEYVWIGLLLLFVFVSGTIGVLRREINHRRNRGARTRRLLERLESLSRGEKAILRYCVQEGQSSIDMPRQWGEPAATLEARGILRLVPRPMGSNTYIVDADIWDAIQQHGLFKEERFD